MPLILASSTTLWRVGGGYCDQKKARHQGRARGVEMPQMSCDRLL